MNVYGIAITEDQIDRVISRMREGEFTAHQLELVAMKAGVPNQLGMSYEQIWPASRMVDRLIQRERKSGAIKFNKNRWAWCPTGSATSSRSG